MSSGTEVERFIKDPRLLVELCREVIEKLDSERKNSETPAMEAQLREIAHAINKLEKQDVAVPETLRAEKTRLAAAIGDNSEVTQTINHFTDELEELVKDLKIRIGRTSDTKSSNKVRAKRSKSPKTDKSILRQLIIEALKQLGGSAHKNEVLRYMERKLNGKLLPGDLEWRESSNDYAWQNNTCWERYAMTQDGVLKTGSPRGIWELSEDNQ